MRTKKVVEIKRFDNFNNDNTSQRIEEFRRCTTQD